VREVVYPLPLVTVQVIPVIADTHRNGPTPVALPHRAKLAAQIVSA